MCGITQTEELNMLSEMGVHYAGFIFYEKSARFAGEKLEARRVRQQQHIKKTGVFVNASENYILYQVKNYKLSLIQLHGDESPEFCKALNQKVPVMKAFRMKNLEDFQKIASYNRACHYFLFDTPGKLYGGNGVSFDWSLLNHYKEDKAFFLSGGIGLEAVEKLKNFNHPAWKAIDINSKFEIKPGIKNMNAIKQFLWDLNIS